MSIQSNTKRKSEETHSVCPWGCQISVPSMSIQSIQKRKSEETHELCPWGCKALVISVNTNPQEKMLWRSTSRLSMRVSNIKISLQSTIYVNTKQHEKEETSVCQSKYLNLKSRFIIPFTYISLKGFTGSTSRWQTDQDENDTIFFKPLIF